MVGLDDFYNFIKIFDNWLSLDEASLTSKLLQRNRRNQYCPLLTVTV